MNPETAIRPDTDLADLDIDAAIAAGLNDELAARDTLSTTPGLADDGATRDTLSTPPGLANLSPAPGLAGDGAARRHLFTAAAIAAALRLEPFGTGPYPIRFLARYVRAAGRSAALELPEPLVGAQPTILARQWLSAASTVDNGLAADHTFAQWLDMVAALVAIRRSTR